MEDILFVLRAEIKLLFPNSAFQYSPYVAFFKEEIFVCKNDNCGGNGNADCFNAFCRLCHRNFFLHEVYKKVKNNTCKYASVIFHIHPCCYKTERNNGNKKVEHI